jgi:hypothetical protein
MTMALIVMGDVVVFWYVTVPCWVAPTVTLVVSSERGLEMTKPPDWPPDDDPEEPPDELDEPPDELDEPPDELDEPPDELDEPPDELDEPPELLWTVSGAKGLLANTPDLSLAVL